MYNDPGTLTTPAGNVTFNDASGTTGWHDANSCTGLGMAPVRPVVENRPQAPGGIWQPFLAGPRRIVLAGTLLIDETLTVEADRFAEIVTWEAALTAALESTLDADTATYSWVSGGDTYTTAPVRCELAFDPAGNSGVRRYTFGLVAIDPTITVS